MNRDQSFLLEYKSYPPITPLRTNTITLRTNPITEYQSEQVETPNSSMRNVVENHKTPSQSTPKKPIETPCFLTSEKKIKIYTRHS